MNHKEHIEEIAQAAAALYGQDWRVIPGWTRDRWREAVRNTNRGGGDNDMDRIAGRAIDEWYKRREGVADAPPEPEPPPKLERAKKTKGVK